MAKQVLINQFGEKSINTIAPTSGGSTGLDQSIVQASPAKTGVTAIAALAGGADLPTTVAAFNALLAALKAVV